MTRRGQQFLEVYSRYRMDDQLAWYRARIAEYEAARRQSITLSGVLLFLTTLSGGLASLNPTGQRAAWAIAASLFSGLSAAVASYEALMGFERTAKLYRDALASLEVIRAESPDPRETASAAGADQALEGYVSRVEAVFRREGGQWGQLLSSASQAPERDAGSPIDGAEP